MNRRSFFGLLAAAPIAVPAMVKAVAAEPQGHIFRWVGPARGWVDPVVGEGMGASAPYYMVDQLNKLLANLPRSGELPGHPAVAEHLQSLSA